MSRDLTLEAILIPGAFLVPNVHCSVIIRETAVRLSQFRTLKRLLKCEKKMKNLWIKAFSSDFILSRLPLSTKAGSYLD